MVASRKFYSPEFKVRVLDSIVELKTRGESDGAIAKAARLHELSTNTVYGWTVSEKDIRKAARKLVAVKTTESGTPKVRVVHPIEPMVPPIEPLPDRPRRAPKVVVKNVTGWLEGLVQTELDGVVDRHVQAIVEKKLEELGLGGLEERIKAIVRRELGEAFSELGRPKEKRD